MEKWPEIQKNPLPADLAGLPTIFAKEWLRVADGHVRPTMEGTAFDRYGNLYFTLRTYPGSCLCRVSPDKKFEKVYARDDACMIGTAVHKDGRLFVADIDGNIFVLSKDGKLERELLSQFKDRKYSPNDLCFDTKGNIYFTDFTGDYQKKLGGVYRLDAAENYEKIHLVVGELSTPNGVAFSADWSKLWVSQTGSNESFKVAVDENGDMVNTPFKITAHYQMCGYEMFDSLKVDEGDNCYIAVMYGGRLLVVNKLGVPVGNVIIKNRELGEKRMTSNVAIKPGTNEGYLVTSDESGSYIYTFPTLAKAMQLYSDL